MSDINERYGYKPYEGGAGPSEEQTAALDKLLLDTVIAEGGAAHMGPALEDYGLDTDVVWVGSRSASYDRWGYCNADGLFEGPDNDILDQEDLATTVKYLLGG